SATLAVMSRSSNGDKTMQSAATLARTSSMTPRAACAKRRGALASPLAIHRTSGGTSTAEISVPISRPYNVLGSTAAVWNRLPKKVGPSTAAATAIRPNPVMRLARMPSATARESPRRPLVTTSTLAVAGACATRPSPFRGSGEQAIEYLSGRLRDGVGHGRIGQKLRDAAQQLVCSPRIGGVISRWFPAIANDRAFVGCIFALEPNQSGLVEVRSSKVQELEAPAPTHSHGLPDDEIVWRRGLVNRSIE